MVIDIRDGNQAVFVAIGVAVAEPVHDRLGEDGPHALAGWLVAFKGVFGAAGSSQNDPAAAVLV